MKFSIVLPVVFVVLAVSLMLARGEERDFATTGFVTLDDRRIGVALAATDADRARGLSGVASMGEDEGMLFVFDETRPHGFWMKDMRFPIDIVWFDEDGTAIDFVQNFSPDSFPRVEKPAAPSLRVLELPAGSVARYKIVPGVTKLGAYAPY